MSQKIVYTCDSCTSTADVGEHAHINVFTTREMDPSGNGYDNHTVGFDLCHRCAVLILGQMTQARTVVPGVQIDGVKFADWLTRRKPKG